MYRSYQTLAQYVPDYSHMEFSESRAEALTMKLELPMYVNEITIPKADESGVFVVCGTMTLKVLYDEGADEEDRYWIEEMVDASGLFVGPNGAVNSDEYFVEYGLLADKPSFQEIVDHLNDNIAVWADNLKEI